MPNDWTQAGLSGHQTVPFRVIHCSEYCREATKASPRALASMTAPEPCPRCVLHKAPSLHCSTFRSYCYKRRMRAKKGPELQRRATTVDVVTSATHSHGGMLASDT